MPGDRRTTRNPRTPIRIRVAWAAAANATAVTATAPAAPSSTARMPPADSSTGTRTAPRIPPSGTAIWRTPNAQPRRSGPYARKSAAVPAIVTTDEPRPKSRREPPRTRLLPASAAATRPPAAASVPTSIDAREPKRSIAIDAGTSERPAPKRLTVSTAPSPGSDRPNSSRSSGPIAGKPKLTNETATWAADALASTARGEGTNGGYIRAVDRQAIARAGRARQTREHLAVEREREAALQEELEDHVGEAEGPAIDEEVFARMDPEDARLVREASAGVPDDGPPPGDPSWRGEGEEYAAPGAERDGVEEEVARLERELATCRRRQRAYERYLELLGA